MLLLHRVRTLFFSDLMLHSQEQKYSFEWLSMSMDVLWDKKCAATCSSRNTLVQLPVLLNVLMSACKNGCVCYNVTNLLGCMMTACLRCILIHIKFKTSIMASQMHFSSHRRKRTTLCPAAVPASGAIAWHHARWTPQQLCLEHCLPQNQAKTICDMR